MADNPELKINKFYNKIIRNEIRELMLSKNKIEKNEDDMKNSNKYDNKILKEMEVENYLRNLDFTQKFINSFFDKLTNKIIFFNFAEERKKNNIFLQIINTISYIKVVDKNYSKYFSPNKMIDNNKIFINMQELLNILSYSIIYKNYSNSQLETSIIMTDIMENSPLKIYHFIKMKENLLKMDSNYYVKYEQINNNNDNSILVADKDQKFSKFIEYRDKLNELDNQIKNPIYDKFESLPEIDKDIHKFKDKDSYLENKDKIGNKKNQHFNHFISGALSGIISRTLTAPLERLKIIFQVNYVGRGIKPPGVLKGIKEVYCKEGLRGLFRGNLVNLMKTTPDFAIKLYTFSKSKYYLCNNNANSKIETFSLLLCGGISGMTATICIYPLDVIKTRLSANSFNIYNGIFDTTRKLYEEGGFTIFYKGIKPSLISAIPNSGLNLFFYDTLKKKFSGSSCTDNGKLLSGPKLMLIGALSAFFSSSIFYPFQTLQSRIIMGNKFFEDNYKGEFENNIDKNNNISKNLNFKNYGFLKFAKMTYYKEGLIGFYKGYIPGISKIMIGNAIGYSLYEKIREILD
jgi:solute carrier family 25 phosphate transporter 23/24/25/41